MFKIIPYGRGDILSDVNNEAAGLLASLVSDAELCDPAERPFVQLSHSEIPEDDLETVLGYGGITKANAPVGLPCDFEPERVGQYLLFPLAQLEGHLRQTHGELISEYERHGSLDELLESRDLPARDYLVAGLLDCINWCFKHRAALIIRW
jgi:hypothetical protein